MEPQRPPGVPQRMRKLNPTVIALLGGLVVVLLLVWFLATSRNSNQDKLTGNELSQATPADPSKRCASQATYDLIKRELFRRAAELRGSDQGAYDRLSGYAVVRMENPVLESQDRDTGALNCSGSLSLDLPPGVAVVGGRRSLTADVDYTLQRAADGSGDVILLKNADGIIAPLATLARTAAQPAAPAAQTAAVSPPIEVPDGVDVEPPAAPATPAPAPPREQPAQTGSARPSFNCANARTRGEIAVCGDSGLAALDRSMAAQYGRAASGASPDQRALLQRTRDRFLAYRDRCPNRACMAEAYSGRIREIRDIMEGHWQPPQ